MDAPKCFISYSRDTPKHTEWVRHLAEELQNRGVQVVLDQWDLFPGADLVLFMEKSVRESDFVVLVCTSNFAKKADQGVGGVGYEKAIVTGEIFTGAGRPGKFVPVLREGDPKTSLPSYLKSKMYIDFRQDTGFLKSLEELLRHIHGSPRFLAPPVGKKPNLPSVAVKVLVPSTKDSHDWLSIYCSRCGAAPGAASTCPGWTSHNFVSPHGSVYCSRCGTVPGQLSQCPGWTSHNFVEGTLDAYCSRCGALPGQASKCPGWTSHNFVSPHGSVYCSRCGTVPGQPSQCPGWTSHKFVKMG